MTRVALVLNPVSAHATRARRALERACAATGLGEPLVLTTTVEQTGAAQAGRALAAGVERVVVAGGDGTARAVAGALAQAGGGEGTAGLQARSRPETSTVPTLGVLPVGTANLFARSARLPRRDLDAAARLAVTGAGRPTDVGLARLVAADGTSRTEPFLVVVGLGHDAGTLTRVDPARKARVGWPAYVTPGLRRLTSPGLGVEVSLDGAQPQEPEVWSVLAVNDARLPLRARVAPQASLDDGRLHLAVVSPRHLADWARVAWTGLGGRHTPHPALHYLDARQIRLRPERPTPAQVDGDVVLDIVEATIQIQPAALRVARP